MPRSIPSILASLCLAVGLSPFFGGALTNSVAEEPVGGSADSSPMHFALYTDGSPETCASPSTCRMLIAASGMITADTPRQFVAFVRDNALQPAPGAAAAQPPATVALESDGGSVLGAIELGRAIRRAGFGTTVGRVVERRSTPAMNYGDLNTRADCQSMCTFVLLAGVQRHVAADSRVLVHQIWLGDRREDAVASNYTAEDLVVVQRDIGSILQYTLDMGGEPELIELSLKVPPWEPMRVLSRDEIRRTRLDMDADLAPPPSPPVVRTAAGPVVAEDEAMPVGNGHGWVTGQRGGQPVLLRTHPLTFEGERIGSFSLAVGCGAAPDTYSLTYRELRLGPADRGVPRGLNQIALVLEEHLQPLKIASSDKKAHGGELESVATTVLPARLVRTLSGDTPASMTLETDSVGNPRTMIRIGNVGFSRGFHDLERSCREQPQHAAAVTQAR